MRFRHRGRGALAIALVLAVVAGGAVSVATGRVAVAGVVHDNSGSVINETVVSPFTFVTRVYENVSTGTNITINFFNGDTTGATHTFTILDRANYQVPTGSPTSTLFSLIKAAANNTTNGTLANVSTAAEGNTKVATFAAPAAAGYYEFFCVIPGHFADGMFGFIVFGEYIDPSFFDLGSSTPGPGLAVFIIVGTIVSLTVLAIVLGFVVGRRRGSEFEMPPERLGYPEPQAPPEAPQLPPKAP